MWKSSEEGQKKVLQEVRQFDCLPGLLKSTQVTYDIQTWRDWLFLLMLSSEALFIHEAPPVSTDRRSCVSHQGKSVVTFLILLDWKNIANMVWSGKSFDAEALQINPWMPYGLHSSPNLFPINVCWILCRANMCSTRLGKTEGQGEQFVAKSDYYDLSVGFFSPYGMIDGPQSCSKASKQENIQTLSLRAPWAHLTDAGARLKPCSTQKGIKK